MKTTKNKILAGVAGVLFVALVFMMGVLAGYENRPEVEKITDLINKTSGQPSGVDFEPFWKAWSLVNEHYVNGNSTSTADKKISDQEKVWGAISGMVAALGDPYTVFMPPQEKKKFEEEIQGNFSGVGMEMGMKDGVPTVIAPLEDSPAQRAGIKAGDRVIKVNDKTVAGLSIDETINLIRGKEGTSVTLTLDREKAKEPLVVKITREVINIPTIKTETVNGKKAGQKIFVIRLYNFSAPSANAFRGALKTFSEAGTNKLILDLRGNPGGYLESAVDMASWFLPKGKAVVREDRGNGEPEKVYRSAGYDVFTDKLKMVILVDRGSASASEILAGALSEHGKAKLVGEKTFGKGSVQELVPVTGDSSIKVTIAKWLTPNGVSISKNGLTPDYVVPVTEDDVKNQKDPQLDKAVELLSQN